MRYKRVVVRQYGEPEMLEVVEETLMEPEPDQVRLRVKVAGVAFGDIAARRGHYPWRILPFSPGFDVMGVVDQVGAEVKGLAVGQTVAALPVMGGYTEYLCLPAEEVAPVPEGLDPAEVVSLVLNYLTAYQMLHRLARVRAGERVLIHSAAGGVGTALLQLGRLARLEMYGTASSIKHSLVQSLGATPIDHRNEDFVAQLRPLIGEGLDVVFDSLGGGYTERSYRLLRPAGRLVAYGFSAADSGKQVETDYARITQMEDEGGPSVSFYGVAALKKSHPDWFRADLALLLGLLAQQQIQPVIAARLPLEQAAQAHTLLEQGKVQGKIVLVCSP